MTDPRNVGSSPLQRIACFDTSQETRIWLAWGADQGRQYPALAEATSQRANPLGIPRTKKTLRPFASLARACLSIPDTEAVLPTQPKLPRTTFPFFSTSYGARAASSSGCIIHLRGIRSVRHTCPRRPAPVGSPRQQQPSSHRARQTRTHPRSRVREEGRGLS